MLLMVYLFISLFYFILNNSNSTLLTGGCLDLKQQQQRKKNTTAHFFLEVQLIATGLRSFKESSLVNSTGSNTKSVFQVFYDLRQRSELGI